MLANARSKALLPSTGVAEHERVRIGCQPKPHFESQRQGHTLMWETMWLATVSVMLHPGTWQTTLRWWLWRMQPGPSLFTAHQGRSHVSAHERWRCSRLESSLSSHRLQLCATSSLL